jgi:hypothetical protein
LISATKFHSEFWEAAPILVEKFEFPISVTDSVDIFSHFLVKDLDFVQRGNLPQFLVDFTMVELQSRRAEFIEWSEFAKLMTSLILRLTNHPLIIAAIPELIQMIVKHFGEDDVLGPVILMNSLMMTNLPSTIAAMGGSADVYIQFWVDHPVFTETAAAAVASFNTTLQADVLYSITELLCGPADKVPRQRGRVRPGGRHQHQLCVVRLPGGRVRAVCGEVPGHSPERSLEPAGDADKEQGGFVQILANGSSRRALGEI